MSYAGSIAEGSWQYDVALVDKVELERHWNATISLPSSTLSSGRFPPIKRRRKRSLYVATIEKANGLLNALIEAGRIDSLGVVVLDEAHLMGDGDGGRGWQLEAAVLKLRAASSTTQLVAMSATIGNLEELTEFLGGRLFRSSFRPVELEETVLVGRTLHRLHLGADRPLQRLRELEKPKCGEVTDPDGLVDLVSEVIPTSSCLVFCPTKQGAENVALHLARHLPKHLKEHRKDDKLTLFRDLGANLGKDGLCSTLRRCLPYGIAYHHSGLTAEERRLLQEAFSAGILTCLAATSTLAAGVNLPARRVIIRGPMVGRRLMSPAEYRQMAGRAGRAGLDTQGESVLLLPTQLKDSFLAAAACGLPECRSSLLADDAKGLRALVLSLLTLKLVASESTLLKLLIRSSLLGAQAGRLGTDIATALGDVLNALQSAGLVEKSESG